MVNRNTEIEKMQHAPYDVCIIGAGASGAGCALDAALRGLRVLLIDRGDFSGETSSKSTKLIHGGVRYLEQAFKNLDFGQLRQVRHGLEERHLLLANAPHLSRPLGLITPVFSWVEGLYFSIGLKLYGLFASSNDNLPASKWLNKKSAQTLIPTLSEKMHSAVLYYDGQLDDARFAFALAQSASEAGATIINYLEVIDFQKDPKGKIIGATLADKLSGDTVHTTVRAKVFLNCTGPFADHIRVLANAATESRIRPSKGVHAVLPFDVLNSQYALLIPKTPDGRVVFAIPFHQQVLLGTTDELYSDLEKEPVLEAKEVDFLLETLAPYLSRKVHKEEIAAGFGGIRPLITAGKKQTKGLLRDHEVEVDETSGLFSLLGGKWTTYRIMARDAVDAVCRHLGHQVACNTENQPLSGAEGYHPEDWEKIKVQTGLDEDICRHLSQNYGSRASLVIALMKDDPQFNCRLSNHFPFIAAEVVYAARYEMCCTIRDFLARRVRLEILNWEAAKQSAATVAQLLAGELHWDNEKKEMEVINYRNLLDQLIAKSK